MLRILLNYLAEFSVIRNFAFVLFLTQTETDTELLALFEPYRMEWNPFSFSLKRRKVELKRENKDTDNNNNHGIPVCLL